MRSANPAPKKERNGQALHDQFEGRQYSAAQPEIIDVEQADTLLRSTFDAPKRVAFRLIGIKQVMPSHLANAQVAPP
jgi:hypothetical protein